MEQPISLLKCAYPGKGLPVPQENSEPQLSVRRTKTEDEEAMTSKFGKYLRVLTLLKQRRIMAQPGATEVPVTVVSGPFCVAVIVSCMMFSIYFC